VLGPLFNYRGNNVKRSNIHKLQNPRHCTKNQKVGQKRQRNVVTAASLCLTHWVPLPVIRGAHRRLCLTSYYFTPQLRFGRPLCAFTDYISLLTYCSTVTLGQAEPPSSYKSGKSYYHTEQEKCHTVGEVKLWLSLKAKLNQTVLTWEFPVLNVLSFGLSL